MFTHNPRRMTMGTAALLLGGGLLLTAAAWTAAPAAEPVEVLLEGHDQSIFGYLRKISESRYLLQGDDVYHDFPGDQIVTVDGQDEIPASVDGSGRLIFTSFYEKVLANGDVEVWSHNEVANQSAKFLTGTDWGAAAWEKEQLGTLEVYDNFSNRLPLRVTPREDGGFRVEVDFLVPVAPRESLGLTLKTVRRGEARREGDVWSYTFNLGFNEDRYLTRKIELPAGAEVIASYRGAWPVESGGRRFLISQRYYPALTEDPLTVTYKLP